MLNRRRLLALLGLAPVVAGTRVHARAASVPVRAPLVLLRTRVNGEHYYEAGESLRTLAPGAPLTLRREPANAYDRRAIELFDAAGRKLGYVPRIDNPAVARMMDAGERMRARVTAVTPGTRDIRIVVEWLRG
jgi:hypothetical protein